MNSRRKFLGHSIAAIAGAALFKPGQLLASDFFQSDTLSFDLHCHPGIFFGKGMKTYTGDSGVVKTVTEMNTGRLSGAFFSLVADLGIIEITPTGVVPKGSYPAGEAWKEYKRQLSVLKELFKSLPVLPAKRVADLDKAVGSKKVAAFISCEGGEFLDGNADHLDEMYADGVRSLQLVHYAPNVLGDLQTAEPQHHGLSKSGKEVVAKMNKLGMVVDVAHASYDTVKAAVDITDSPIILSHSILKMEENRPIGKRAISVEHAKLIAKTDGIIGAWPSGFNTSFDEFVDNTLRLVDAVGIDHVGLGTDMDSNFKPVFNSYLQLPQWAEALTAKGLSNEEMGKVLGGNARRVLGKVLK